MNDKPRHRQDNGKPYVCQDTPDLFAERFRIKRNLTRAAAGRKTWGNKQRMREANVVRENVSRLDKKGDAE